MHILISPMNWSIIVMINSVITTFSNKREMSWLDWLLLRRDNQIKLATWQHVHWLVLCVMYYWKSLYEMSLCISWPLMKYLNFILTWIFFNVITNKWSCFIYMASSFKMIECMFYLTSTRCTIRLTNVVNIITLNDLERWWDIIHNPFKT